MSHLYSVYGLPFRSRLAIPGLEPIRHGIPTSNRAIEISVGAQPKWAKGALALPSKLIFPLELADREPWSALRLFELGGGQFFKLLYADSTAFVVDAQASRIWGWYPPPLTLEDLASYLVGPVMGFVLRQRHILALHASCLCIGGYAFALCGGPGSGKSTTAAAMALRRTPILCEDIVALHERKSVFFVAPAYPRINLWPDSATNLFSAADTLPRIAPGWEKRFFSLRQTGAKFDCLQRPLAAVYMFDGRSDSERAPRIEAIASSKDATLALVQNTYMNYLIGKSLRANEFDALTRLVSQITVRRLVPHCDPARLETMCELLETDARKIAAENTPSILASGKDL